MISKAKRRLLSDLKQLKIRQKCVEKNVTWPIKLNDLEDDELEFLKTVEMMKAEKDKEFKINFSETKSTVKECLSKIHELQRTVADCDEALLATRPSDLLKTMADINILLSENLFICDKEIKSLRHQNCQDRPS
jgi:hypothetical protein